MPIMNRKAKTIPAEGCRSLFGGLAGEPRRKPPSSATTTPDTTSPDFCLACRGRCVWTSSINTASLARRRDELQLELQDCEDHASTTVQSLVARSAINGGDTMFIRRELINELYEEIKQIDSKLLLARIDFELHRTYASKNESVTICSVHGYDVTVDRREGISLLEHEHDKHIAQIVSVEVIDDILEWMLEGWYFGERDTKRNGQIVESPSHDQRGSLVDKASSVQRSSNAKAKAYHVTHLRESTKEDLKGVEANMKYGLFCLTLMYFRALHILRKEKATWDGSNGGSSYATPMSEERKKMIQESKNAEFRIARMEYAMQKAKSGAERKMRKLEQERLEAETIKQSRNKKIQSEHKLATVVQSAFRGYLGRKVASLHAQRHDWMKAAEVERSTCATNIARVWRGYCGRIDAGYLRAEMAKFLFAIREEEVRDEEQIIKSMVH